MFDMFDNFVYFDFFLEVEIGIFKDVFLIIVFMIFMMLSGRNDFKYGIGLLGEEIFFICFYYLECYF